MCKCSLNFVLISSTEMNECLEDLSNGKRELLKMGSQRNVFANLKKFGCLQEHLVRDFKLG